MSNIYGEGALLFFRLPALNTAIEDPEQCVILGDTYPDQSGLGGKRAFLHVTLTDAETSVIPPFKDQRALLEHLKMLEFFDGSLTCTWGFVKGISYRTSGSMGGIQPIGTAIIEESGRTYGGRFAKDLEDYQCEYLLSRVITAHEEIGVLHSRGAITIIDDEVVRGFCVTEGFEKLVMPRIPSDYFDPDDLEKLEARYASGILLRRQAEQEHPELFRPHPDDLPDLN
jgi:hypothetical protein